MPVPNGVGFNLLPFVGSRRPRKRDIQLEYHAFFMSNSERVIN